MRDRIFALALIVLGACVLIGELVLGVRGDAKAVSTVFWSMVAVFAIACGVAWLREPDDR